MDGSDGNAITSLWCNVCKVDITATATAHIIRAGDYQIVVGVSVKCDKCGEELPNEIPVMVEGETDGW